MSETNHYPGRDTEFFVVLGGVPTGPVVGLVELFRHNITPDTPVWYEGLDDWKPALMTSLTRQLFEPNSEFYRVHPEALVIMQGRMTGGDPSDMPDLVPDTPGPKPVEAHQSVPTPVETRAPQSRANRAHTAAPVTESDAPTRPAAYLAWSIVMTLLCCLPAGIVAIIYSCRVNSKWARGEYDEAVKASNRAQLWIVLSFVLGLIWTVTSVVWAPFGVSIFSIFGF